MPSTYLRGRLFSDDSAPVTLSHLSNCLSSEVSLLRFYSHAWRFAKTDMLFPKVLAKCLVPWDAILRKATPEAIQVVDKVLHFLCFLKLY